MTSGIRGLVFFRPLDTLDAWSSGWFWLHLCFFAGLDQWSGMLGQLEGQATRCRVGRPSTGSGDLTTGMATQALVGRPGLFSWRSSTLALDMFSTFLCSFWYIHPNIHTSLMELISTKGRYCEIMWCPRHLKCISSASLNHLHHFMSISLNAWMNLRRMNCIKSVFPEWTSDLVTITLILCELDNTFYTKLVDNFMLENFGILYVDMHNGLDMVLGHFMSICQPAKIWPV